MITRGEILAIYDALSPAELAILLGLGGTLPHNARHREPRLRDAVKLARREKFCGRPTHEKRSMKRKAAA